MSSDVDDAPGNSNASYVQADFLLDLLEPWIDLLPHDDWGIYLSSLWQTAKAAVSLGYFDKAKGYADDILAELDHAFTRGYMSTTAQGAPKARREFGATRKFWHSRANFFNCLANYRDVMTRLPSWIKPPPRRLKSG